MTGRRIRRIPLLALLALGAAPAAAPAAAQELRSAGPAESELGHLVFANTGAPAAQEPFLRGVLALHSFWFEEAQKAFAEAQQIDPGFALAYWGEAMTWDRSLWGGRKAGRGLEVLERLRALPGHERARWTDRERAYLDAADSLFADGPTRERRRAFTAAMERIAADYPDDDEAIVFHALGVLATNSNRRDGRDRILAAAERLERVFERNPDHPGVLHYLIHAYDSPGLAERGLPMARRYASVAPAAYHALHMPAHIFRHLELWDDVAASCLAAYEASVAWVAREGLPDTRRDFHSLDWLHDAYLRLDRLDDARALHDHVRELIQKNPGSRTIERQLEQLERAYGQRDADMPSTTERQLVRIRARFDAAIQELPRTGFRLKGSVVKARRRCGSAGCGCQGHPAKWHGPYWQWTSKRNGKTVTRALSSEQVDRYREWMENAKRFEEIVAKLYELSAQANEILRDAERQAPAVRARTSTHPQRTRSARRSLARRPRSPRRAPDGSEPPPHRPPRAGAPSGPSAADESRAASQSSSVALRSAARLQPRPPHRPHPDAYSAPDPQAP